MITPEILKRIRFENNDISQNELAKKLGVSKQYISDLERGKSPISHKFEAKLRELGFLIEKEENPLSQYIEDLQKKLSQEQLDLLFKMIVKEPELMIFAAKAIEGDDVFLDRFYKIIKG